MQCPRLRQNREQFASLLGALQRFPAHRGSGLNLFAGCSGSPGSDTLPQGLPWKTEIRCFAVFPQHQRHQGDEMTQFTVCAFLVSC